MVSENKETIHTMSKGDKEIALKGLTLSLWMFAQEIRNQFCRKDVQQLGHDYPVYSPIEHFQSITKDAEALDMKEMEEIWAILIPLSMHLGDDPPSLDKAIELVVPIELLFGRIVAKYGLHQGNLATENVMNPMERTIFEYIEKKPKELGKQIVAAWDSRYPQLNEDWLKYRTRKGGIFHIRGVRNKGGYYVDEKCSQV